ncbi:hypothetical protein LguiA_029996 [Lonicera macranthoides]
MTAMMQTGFTSINERVEIMVLRQDRLEADIAAQVEARVAAQMATQQEFEALYGRFPPPPPPDM